ncbi:glycine receptor subunit alpha-2-like [Tubulanus polymorphus]|uniref:glycine receptor subunit alpha-2-like n=1 Tax=Tubulanus polymorphus TaxID=672921 RepID=UPI003DA2BE6B
MEMYINHFGSIDAVNMQFEVDLNLRQRWRDSRLAFKQMFNESLNLGHARSSHIWVPDVYFRNAKQAKMHEITVPNKLLRVSPEGDIVFSQRLALVLTCNMELEFYPLDNQACSIEMESFGFTTKDVAFHWRNVTNPVVFNSEMELPEFNKNINKTYENCSKEYGLGTFPCVLVRLHLTREYGFYLIQTFIPSILIVMLSWVSFWLDPHATPARISLGLLTVLTMTTQISGIVAQLPKVSYVKAIDVWMAVCLIFVFAALLEFAVVNVLVRKEELRAAEMKQREREKVEQVTTETNEKPTDSEVDPRCGKFEKNKQRKYKRYMEVEIGARIAFPFVFALFNLFFWLCTLRVIA